MLHACKKMRMGTTALQNFEMKMLCARFISGLLDFTLHLTSVMLRAPTLVEIWILTCASQTCPE